MFTLRWPRGYLGWSGPSSNRSGFARNRMLGQVKAGEMRRDMWIPRIPVRLQLPITGALLAELLVLGVSPLAIGGREKDAGQKVGCR